VSEIPDALEEVLGASRRTTSSIRKTGEVLLECNQELTTESLDVLRASGVKDVEVLLMDDTTSVRRCATHCCSTTVASPEEAILEIYKRLRPGIRRRSRTATTFFNNLFFNPERYDLSRVGRLKLNHSSGSTRRSSRARCGARTSCDVVRYLIELKNGNGQTDDIDHLGNRRVRAVGELVENQYRIGLVRMERAIKERMSLQDIETLMPQELINYKPVSAVIKEFFGSSQLSQFMDQTNPLSEITHKRRLSALGPGGLTRERAGFEVRDVHPTHYGRVCPIETPEGPNIGLIASLSTYARVNEFGFVETPYREVAEGRVSDKVRFLSALEEEDHVIAQAMRRWMRRGSSPPR
jgi:DNA-directed RNA polymerase subunit beta